MLVSEADHSSKKTRGSGSTRRIRQEYRREKISPASFVETRETTASAFELLFCQRLQDHLARDLCWTRTSVPFRSGILAGGRLGSAS